jgi:hypothetical protein
MMLQRRVRLLFVLEPAARRGRDHRDRPAGREADALHAGPRRRAREITVGDIMTPASMLEAMPVQDVAQMLVGHIVATLKHVNRQHLIAADEGGRRVRGIFSTSRIAAQLGVELATSDVALTFAEIEAALAH